MSNREWQFGDWCERKGERLRFLDFVDGYTGVVSCLKGSRKGVFNFAVDDLTYLPHCDSWGWQPPATIDPGEGWRLLEKGELVEEGDQRVLDAGEWVDASNWLTETRQQGHGCIYRRRIVQPLQLREGAWYERRDGKVVGPCMRRCGEVEYPWRVVGYWYTDNGMWRNSVTHGAFDLIREVPAPTPPQPVYRPFASAEEFEPHCERWVIKKGEKGKIRVMGYDDHGARCLMYGSYRSLFESHIFSDGTPFGMPE